MAKISGKWKFNDVLTLVGNMWWVNYLGGGTECYAITIGTDPPQIKNLSLWYEAKNTSIGRIQAYMEGPGWLGNIYKTIDFGDAEQTVDDSFYEWLTANATKVLTFADKLTIITENVPKVYDAGKTAGHTAGYAEGEIKGYENGYTEGINKGGYADGYEEGKKAEYDAFWDGITDNGNRTDYYYGFFKWGNEYIRPNRKIIPTVANSSNQTFSQCPNLKKVEAQYFDFSQKPVGTVYGEGYYYTFNQCKSLEEVEDIGMQADFNCTYLFSGCSKLHTVAILRVNENTTFSNTFGGCSALQNITFDGVIGENIVFKSCTKLSADSIRSIITHLSDTSSGKTLTLSKTAVENSEFNDGTVSVKTNGKYIGAGVHCNPIPLSKGDKLKVTFEVADGHHYNDHWQNSADPSDWYIGMSPYGAEPNYTEYVYTADYDGLYDWLYAYVSTPSAMTVSFKLRAVLVDDDGNEITGENLFSPIVGSFGDYTIYGGFEALVASKPLWVISLV